MKTILWIVVIALLVFGGYELSQHGTTDGVRNNQSAATKESTTSDASKKMAFSAFLKTDKGSYRCTVDQYLSDMDSNGVVYANGDTIRGDFSNIAEGKTMQTSFLIKDGYQYLWSPGVKNNGVRMRVADGDTGSTQADAMGAYSWSAEQIGAYDCEPWKSNAATFTLPSGVVFTDLGAMMKAM